MCYLDYRVNDCVLFFCCFFRNDTYLCIFNAFLNAFLFSTGKSIPQYICRICIQRMQNLHLISADNKQNFIISDGY